MKLSKVHPPSLRSGATSGPQSEVQSDGGKPRPRFNFGHGTLGFRLRPSNFGDRDGVALVITLIMLAIITFMAVTFLVLSQRERSSVSTAMDQKTARNASDAGLARVSAELLTRIMLHTNFQDLDLMVSTNYINLQGLHGGSPTALSPTNVNYEYLNNPQYTAITDPQDREINIASLLYNPRPPVYVTTNVGTGETEFRYYIDLNRNGRYDKSGYWPVVVTDNTGKPFFVNTNGTLVSTNLPVPAGNYLLTNYFVGDPDWIGVLERPEELHSADNRFIGRYAYIVLPVGKMLDVNYIHNHAKPISALQEGFLRNQGVGTWEINLAGFLADLNTNAWWNPLPGYNYFQNNFASTGAAFTNANDFLNFRYGTGGYLNLYPARAVLASSGPGALAAALAAYNIDVYSDGPLMLTFNTNESSPSDFPIAPWSGSENTNHFFSHQDIFSQMPAGFRNVMSNLGTSNDSYNAYTFYRLLAQLGTDSAVETNKINVNFKNTDLRGNIVPGMETNLIPWTPIDFFTNAANRILAQFTNEAQVALSTTNIPIYPTNSYTPAVHRALQMAANIFDATTNQTVPLVGGQTNAYFPSVFRPIFMSQNGKVWINGFVEVTNTDPLSFQYYDMAKASNSPGTLAGVNIYGIPWVIGAKKDFPNFNEFAMETAISMSRKLKLSKPSAGNFDINDVRQMFEVGISNTLALEAWNSYTNFYPRTLRISASNELAMGLTNQFNQNLFPSTWVNNLPFQSATNISGGNWAPFLAVGNPNDRSIIVPLQTNYVFFTNATYLDTPQFIANNPAAFNMPASLPMPELFLTVTNRVQFSMVDTSVTPNRVVDFVNLEDISTLNISAAIRHATTCGNNPTSDPYIYWCTNQITPPSTPFTPGVVLNQGINYQLGVASGMLPGDDAYWKSIGVDPGNTSQKNSFRDFLFKNPGNTNLVMQTPFNPVGLVYEHTSWQVNDPLVHYTIGDMTDPQKAFVDTDIGHPSLKNIGLWNTRYRPWGGYTGNPDPNTDENPSVKDPGIFQSSGWDFPTNKLPNIGWLGRVHRGTPWQTVYMKSPLVNLKDWQEWSGNAVQEVNGNQDAGFTMPNRDYGLFDLFTTAINGSAARGQLNVNQTNLASWSAILSGVNVLTNDPNTGVIGPAVIAPAGVYDTNNPTPMARIWQGILNTRANTDTNFTIFPNQTFQHVGDILATPQLTMTSPFLNTNKLYLPNAGGMTDELVERIPQQIMSLLTLNQAPRFVIYSFGQTLHPADHSLVIGGTFNGLCTNYQITAESAVRAVVHVEGTPDPKMIDGRVDSQGRSYPPHLVVEQFNVLGPD